MLKFIRNRKIISENDTALDLYADDIKDPFYQTHGFYGRPHFEELGRRIGILPRRTSAIIDSLLHQTEKVKAMVDGSFLSEEIREKYVGYYMDKVKRFEVE